MKFLWRLVSPTYRKALAAEAEGDFLTAAKHFALCGERRKVAQMHFALARKETNLDKRIQELQNAQCFTSQEDPLHATVLEELGRLLIESGRSKGVKSSAGRATLLQAAAALEQTQKWELAGDCYQTLGELKKAINAYTNAGLLEKVENLLATAEKKHRQHRQEEELYKDYEFLFQGGQRDEAYATLKACIAASSQKGKYSKLLSDFKERLITSGRLKLALGENRLFLVGQFPLWIGRDDTCDLWLSSPAISRRHARIDYAKETDSFFLRDVGSRSGTFLSGVLIGSAMPLSDKGTFRLGQDYAITFSTIPGPPATLRLDFSHMLEQYRFILAGVGNFDIAHLNEDYPPLNIHFYKGRPMAEILGHKVRLNQARLQNSVQLLRGDILDVEEFRIEVL